VEESNHQQESSSETEDTESEGDSEGGVNLHDFSPEDLARTVVDFFEDQRGTRGRTKRAQISRILLPVDRRVRCLRKAWTRMVVSPS